MSASHLQLVVNTQKQRHAASISGVYLITDQKPDLLKRVEQALGGGVNLLQYRPKGKDWQEVLAEGQELKKLCAARNVLFIVNDDAQLAHDLDADGVHLGQEDGTVAEARQILGQDKLVGVSTHSLEEALQAEAEGADYIGFGAMYPTDTKAITHLPGHGGLAKVRSRIKLPIVAIGGITPVNACRIIDSGADALAVISSVLSSPRPDIAAVELRLLFNRVRPLPRGSVLTIAGSDSGGGAGIQADLKTITLLGSYAASVLTALTAQNTKGVHSIHSLPASFVKDQLHTVISDLPVDVIKTGMLHTPAIIAMLAENLAAMPRLLPLVVDPVMVAKGGTLLLERDAVNIFISDLLPQSYLLTPNLPEAERLLNRKIGTTREMEQAARDLHGLGAANVLVKGGHLTDAEKAVDILFDGTEIHTFTSERIFTSSTHGTGCSFASAIAAFLAKGEPLTTAVAKAKQFITIAIRNARPMGKGHGPVNHYIAAQEVVDNK